MGVGALTGRGAVFLDRDGVLNRNVYYADSGEWESPRNPSDLVLYESVGPALQLLRASGYLLFVVSNQPSHAKGKVSLEALAAVRQVFEESLAGLGISLTESFYCLHHPDGTVAEYAVTCRCRKPSPYFLEIAKERYGLDMSASWMIGDRDTDVACGQRAGVCTIQVAPDHPGAKRGSAKPDFEVRDLADAVLLISSRSRE